MKHKEISNKAADVNIAISISTLTVDELNGGNPSSSCLHLVFSLCLSLCPNVLFL
jgi:hypothetical protein